MTNESGLGRAILIGERAQAFASLVGRSGAVLAVVSKAVYLEAGDAIFWLGQAADPKDGGIPPHSRAILGGFDLSPLSVGMPLEVTADALLFDRRYSLALRDARTWRAPEMGRPAAYGILKERHQRLLRGVKALDSAQGLGRAIPLLSDECDSTPLSSGDPFIAAAGSAVRALAAACRERDAERILSSALPLIGLGAGLTPSGDDLVGGCLFVLHHLCIAYPELFPAGPVRPGALVAQARSRTNAISYALLCDHARGEAAQPLHRLIAWLLGDQNAGGGKLDLAPLLSIGSTSGWDLLAGLLIGMLWFGGNGDLTILERVTGSEAVLQEGYGHTACH